MKIHARLGSSLLARDSVAGVTSDLELISEQDHAALLGAGIAVLAAWTYEGRLYVRVTGPLDARDVVRARLGADVDVGVCGDGPREIRPIACCGYVERDPGRLQLRYLMSDDRHLDDIVVRETDDTVFIYGTACAAIDEVGGDEMDSPYHVYLERPLGTRTVFDEVANRPVPYRNVYAELRTRWGLPSGV